MTPGLEKSMRETMEKASLHEVMPGTDTAGAWEQLSGQLHPPLKKRLGYTWRYAAAAAGLVVMVGLWAVMQRSVREPAVVVITPASRPSFESTTTQQAQPPIAPIQQPTTIAATTGEGHQQKPRKAGTHGEIITNGTPCPIEIRISQMMKCPDSKPAAISSRSQMEPGETAALAYQTHDSMARNCSFTVNEIAITSIATGETIVLDAHSVPSTAQEVFSYITGQRKGDILAGMFSTDCNNRKSKHRIKLGNREGNLILQ